MVDKAEFIINFPKYQSEFKGKKEILDYITHHLPIINKNLIKLSDLLRKYIIKDKLDEKE